MNKIVKMFSIIMCCLTLMFFTTACSLDELFGENGATPYEIAVANGFNGTEAEWLASLKAETTQGKSAYEIAVDNGFIGTEAEWLESIENSVYSKLQENQVKFGALSTTLARSVVTIYCDSESSGSGVLVEYNSGANEAYIVTTYTTIASGSIEPFVNNNICVNFYGVEETTFNKPVTFLGGAPFSNVAVLKMSITQSEWEKYNLQTAEMNSARISIGETVLAVSNARGRDINVLNTNISRQQEKIEINNFTGSGSFDVNVMRFNAEILENSRGGGLFDTTGKMVGLINSKSSDPDLRNFAYAIPASTVLAIYTNVKDQPSSNNGKIAIKYAINLTLKIKDYNEEDSVLSPTSLDIINDKVYVKQTVVAKQPVGAIEVGDEITSVKLVRSSYAIKNVTVKSIYDLSELMWYAKSGDVIEIRYKKAGVTKTESINVVNTIATFSNWNSVRSDITFA